MFGIKEFELYHIDDTEATQEEFEFYKEEINEILKKRKGIVLAYIVPDHDEGHIEAHEFETWTDAGIWRSQK